MNPKAPVLLSFNAGYVDTAGFLALQGLFTAHVTGNFVTFGAAVAHGTSGAAAKLLALPVFCVVIVTTRLLAGYLPSLGLPVLKTMLSLKVILLAAGAVLAVLWGPFGNGDSLEAIVTGMVLVAAMAIQNAAHRAHMSKAPPTNLMTGTSTQIMLDIADLIGGRMDDKARAAARARLARMVEAVASFAIGCGIAAIVYVLYDMYVFALPPLVALLSLVVVHWRPDPEIS